MLRTFSWLSVVLLMHTASVLCTCESVIFAAVLKQSDGQKFPHACSMCILICLCLFVFFWCVTTALWSSLSLSSPPPRATLCKSMRHWKIKNRKTKQNQWNMRKVSWLWSKVTQAIPQRAVRSALISANEHLEGLSYMFKAKKAGTLSLFTFYLSSDWEREHVLTLKEREGGGSDAPQ